MEKMVFEAHDEWEFYSLSTTLDVSVQPRRISDFLREHYPNAVIQNRSILQRWLGKPYLIEYTLVERKDPQPVSRCLAPEIEIVYDWS